MNLRFRCAVLAAGAAVSASAAGEAHADITPAASAARRLIDATGSDVFHLDLHARGKRPGDRHEDGSNAPWFDGFSGSEEGPAAATVDHPIRRMLLHLREEGVGVEEAMAWAEGEGTLLLLCVYHTRTVYSLHSCCVAGGRR